MLNSQKQERRKYIMIRKIIHIDEDKCNGCGACESICDAVFHVEDRAEVKSAGIAGNEDCVKEAANACPVCAIEVA